MMRSFTLTLASDGSVYNIWTLMNAVSGAIPSGAILPDRVALLKIKSDPGNGGATAEIFDTILTTTATGGGGPILYAGDVEQFGPFPMNCICIRDFNIQGSANTLTIEVTLVSI